MTKVVLRVAHDIDYSDSPGRWVRGSDAHDAETQAAEWVGQWMLPAEAEPWLRVNMTPRDAATFRRASLTPEDALARVPNHRGFVSPRSIGTQIMTGDLTAEEAVSMILASRARKTG